MVSGMLGRLYARSWRSETLSESDYPHSLAQSARALNDCSLVAIARDLAARDDRREIEVIGRCRAGIISHHERRVEHYNNVR